MDLVCCARGAKGDACDDDAEEEEEERRRERERVGRSSSEEEEERGEKRGRVDLKREGRGGVVMTGVRQRRVDPILCNLGMV